ncbi:MAG: hypothetical protein JWQ96_863 [Segetibacter sp.]|nr:hypothetical protein [Segetibacter sp.]
MLAQAQTPVANFSADVVSGCAPLVVKFADLSTGNPTAWSWDLGNGTISTVKNPVTTYVTPGIYSITLTATNSSGSNTITKASYITIYAVPAVDFKTDDSIGCAPLFSRFVNNSLAGSGTIASSEWNFGDGALSSQLNPVHNYTAAGAYGVFLKVTNSFGCSNILSKPQYVKVGTAVNAGFNFSVPSYCSFPVNVSFTNITTGSTLSYVWNFGDGTTSLQNDPQHVFSTPGNFTVTLIAKSSEGCSDTITHTINLPAKTTSFSSPATVCAGTPATFTATSSPSPISFTWKMGDGATYSTAAVNHTYSSSGTYEVTLINDFGGCVDSVKKTINVLALPMANFSAPTTTACKAPFTVNFSDGSTGAIEWSWDFGDGLVSNQKNPSHTYTSPGFFNVRLTIKNSNGCTATIDKAAFVKIVAPKAVVTNIPVSGCAPLSYTPAYTVTQVDGITSYLWKFGDGSTSTASNPTYTYTTVGSFPLTLIITSTGGCTDTFSVANAVNVGTGTPIDFTVSPTQVCGTAPVSFTPIVAAAVSAYTWNFGDNTTSNQQFATHKYSDTGSYSVTLSVNYGGCVSSFTKQDIVKVAGTISRFGFTKDCATQGKFLFANQSVDGQSYKWEFGDGNTSLLVSPTHSYTAAGTYTVKLISTNNACSDTSFKTINVWMGGLQVSTNTNVICKGGRAIITLNHPSPANVVNYNYNFTGNVADGFTTTPSTPVGWDYMQTGNFGFVAYTEDIYGCRDSVGVVQFMRVNGPTAKFDVIKATGCSGTNFTFTDASITDGINSLSRWFFDFGDGTTQTFTSPPFNHVYNNAGTFNVKMKVIDQSGCADSLTRSSLVTVSTAKAKFTSVDSFTCQGKQVRFSDRSFGSPLNYEWDFGDGSSSTLQHPLHLYNNTGLYTIRLIVAAPGCRDTLIKTDFVTVKNPVAKFGVSDTLVSCPPIQVNFTDSSSYVESWRWYFNDGNVSSQQNPVNVYFTPGVYQTKLVATSPGGCKDSSYRSIIVNGPTGTFSYSPLAGCAPAQVSFTATTTGATAFVWDFGDGNSLSTNDSLVTHTFTSQGRFQPTILLKDPRGCVVPYSGNEVIVIEKLSPHFRASSTTFCDSGTVMFTDSTIAVASASHQWYFGDGGTSGVPSPVHKYGTPGNYSVKLVVNSSLGCSDSIIYTNLIKVVASPKPAIIANNTSCSDTVSFSGQIVSDTSSIKSWRWTFGNGQSSQLQTPPVQTFAPGSYSNTLTVTNSSGCSTITTKNLQVFKKAVVLANNDTTICAGSSLQLFAIGASTYLWQGNALSCTTCNNPVASPVDNSFYYVTAQSADGCEAKDSVAVKVIKAFSLSATPDYKVCKDARVQLSASGAPAYTWLPATGLNDVKVSNPFFKATSDIVYQVIGFDSLGCFADTTIVNIDVVDPPTVELGPDVILSVGTVHTFVPKVSNDVTGFSWTPASNLSCSTCPNPVLNSRENATYSLKVSNATGCSAADSVRVIVSCGGSSVFVPNTFSPNGDGSNDVFYVRGKGIYSVQYLRIFNRWGEVIFDKKNLTVNDPSSGWNGTINGRPSDPGVYTYFMEVICNNNQLLKYVGNINLIQ